MPAGTDCSRELANHTCASASSPTVAEIQDVVNAVNDVPVSDPLPSIPNAEPAAQQKEADAELAALMVSTLHVACGGHSLGLFGRLMCTAGHGVQRSHGFVVSRSGFWCGTAWHHCDG